MRQLVAVGFGCLIALSLTGTGCSKKSDANSALLGTQVGSAAGVKWTVPKRWTTAPAKPMRIVTYAVPAADGDSTGAECAVSFFGSGQGGNVEANIERWKSQFENPDAGSPSSKTVNGIKVTTVRISGTYLSPGGMMMQAGPPKPDYCMLGAIIEAPEGVVFYKLTGPKKTVESAQGEFDAIVGSLSK